jgi:hypothetical protein
MFVSGGAALEAAATLFAKKENVSLFVKGNGADVAQERWRELFAASVCLFDIGADDVTVRMQASYELGLAAALGKPCVVAKRPETVLPFDFQQPAIDLSDSADRNAGLVAASVDAALGGITTDGGASQFDDAGELALRELSAYAPVGASALTFPIQMRSIQANVGDAVAFRRSLAQILGTLGSSAPTLLFPQWPPDARDPAERPQCFHITPFRNEFDSVKRALEEVCGRHGWDYVRGDMGSQQLVLPRIWRAICRARAVVIDITGYNLNVGFELGLVHAVGRQYRIIARGAVVNHVFPSIAKMHVHAYNGQEHPGEDERSGQDSEAVKKDLAKRMADVVGPMLK